MRLISSWMLLLLLVAPVFAQGQRRSRSSSAGKAAEAATPLVTMRGTLKVIDKKEIVIETAEEQVVPLRRSKKIKFLKGDKESPERDFQPGAGVVVEVTREPTGELVAVNVSLDQPATAR